MLRELKENILATKEFFLTRFVASALVGLVYLLVAAGIQYQYVKWFGESIFNYISGGLISLFLGSIVCAYLGKLVFMFVRGWHMAALAFSKQINERKLSALDVGMHVFGQHFTSFAMVYSAQLLADKFIQKGADELWELIKDVPYISSLQKFSKNPIVKNIAKDILGTGFDCMMFYIVRHTKPGISDDINAAPKALKIYLYSLKSVLISSLSMYFFTYIVPKVIKYAIIASTFVTQGVVAGILITVILYPAFYLVNHTIFEPLRTMVFVACFAKHCKEEPLEDNLYKSIIDRILESIFPEGMEGTEDAEQSEAASTKKSKKEAEPKYEAEPEVETELEGMPEEPVKESVAEPTPAADDDLVFEVEPDFEEPATSLSDLLKTPSFADVVSKPVTSKAASLKDILSEPVKPSFHSSLPNLDGDDEDDDTPPIRRLSGLASIIDASKMNEAYGVVVGGGGKSSNTLEGGDIDVL